MTRLALLLSIVSAWPALAEEPAAEWPRGWKLRVKAVAAEPSDTYDIFVAHDGLSQSDARDVRVVGPDGQPVSHYVAYADNARFRVVFDGNAGPGTYLIYFGNLVSKVLPPVPDGVSAFGAASPKARKDWLPQGGFTCTSFDPIEKIERADLVNLDQVVKAYENIRVRVAGAEKKEAETQAVPAKRRKFVLKTVHRSSNVDIGNVDAVELLRDEKTPAARVPQNWFHIFRAQIDVPSAGSYQLALGEGKPCESLGVVFVDGNYAKPVIPGWHSNAPTTAGIVFDCIGKADLTPGKHIVEAFTTRRNPEIKWSALSGGAPPEYLRGLDAHYDNCRKLSIGGMEVESGELADVYLSAIKHWAGQDRFSLARSLSRVAQARFAGNAAKLKEFADAFEQAEQRAYETNWLTESKYASRTGSVPGINTRVPELAFAPPLRQTGGQQENYTHDPRHLSSSVWVEGKMIYGLPFDVQDMPWGVTSGVCVADDMLYAGTKNGVMHAVNLSSASERWSFPGGGSCLGCPLLYRESLYFGALDRRLYALDIKTGRMLWNFPANGWIEGGPCAAAGRVFFGSRDRNLYAIDAVLGVERWRAALGGEILATPVTDAGPATGAAGGRVYVGTHAGDFFAVDAASGSVAWKFAAGAAIDGGACLGNNRIVFGDESGKVHCLDAATGKPVWAEPAVVGGPVIAAPIQVGSVLYGGTSEGKLWGIDTETGQVGWKMDMPAGGSIARPALFVEDNLVFTSRERDVRRPDGNFDQLRGATAIFQSAQPAQEKITQTKESFAIDGNLTESVWQSKALSSFYKHNGLSYGNAIEAKIGWEPKQLLVGVVCKDVDVSGVPEAPAKDLREGDSVTVMLDPKGDGMFVCAFTVNPRGAKSQTAATAIGRDSEDAKTKEAVAAMKLDEAIAAWAPTWSAAATIQDGKTPPAGSEQAAATENKPGWIAEIAIPFDALPKPLASWPQNGNQWKINIIVNRHGRTGALEGWGLAPLGSPKGFGAPQRWPSIQFNGQGFVPGKK